MRVCKCCNIPKNIKGFGTVFNTYTSKKTGIKSTRITYRRVCIKCMNTKYTVPYIKKTNYMNNYYVKAKNNLSDYFIKSTLTHIIPRRLITLEVITLKRKIYEFKTEITKNI